MGLVLVGVGTLFLMEQYGNRMLREEMDALRQQAAQIRDENQRLKDQPTTTTASSETQKGELMRLRAQVGALRQTEQENARLKVERDRLAQQSRQQPQSKPEEDYFEREYGPGTRIKVQSAKHWSYALLNFAANHQGHFPASFEQAAPFLADELSEEVKAQAMQAVSELEILYHGLQNDLDALPSESTIIIREWQPWADAQGKWCKAYGMADGHSEIRRSEVNDFEKWERIRIPKPKGQ